MMVSFILVLVISLSVFFWCWYVMEFPVSEAFIVSAIAFVMFTPIALSVLTNE